MKGRQFVPHPWCWSWANRVAADKGFTGAFHVTAGKDDHRAFPFNYGVDDLTLALQDRRFDASVQSG